MSEELVKEMRNGNDVPKTIEPAENEPCLELKNKATKFKFLHTTENKLRKHSGLSRIGLYIAGAVLLVLIILFIVVIVLSVTWPRKLHHELFPICTDSSCLRASAQVQEAMDSSISPCDDVWKFSCGGWLKKHSLPHDESSWSPLEELLSKEIVRIRDLVTTFPVPVRSGTVQRKIKSLYDACMDVQTINSDKDRPLKDIISELGGWTVLRNWNSDDFDKNVLLRRLHVKYSASPYFKISVQPNPGRPGFNSIVISPSGLGLPDRTYYYNTEKNYQQAYKQFVRDTVFEFSGAKVQAEKFGEDMFYYEKRIAEITPHSIDLLNPVNTYNPIRISELKLTASSLPLEDILTEMFPNSNISEETEIIATSLDYLNQVSQIIATTDRETINSYLMWTLVRNYVPYLSDQFTSTWLTFNSELLGVQRDSQRWKKCTILVNKIMSLAIQSMLETQSPINDRTKTIVRNVFTKIIETAQEEIRNYRISPQLRKYLTYKLTKLNLQVGLPNISNNETFLKEHYNKLSIIKTNFFPSIQNGFAFLHKVQENLLTSQDVELNLIPLMMNNPHEITYLPSLNTIVVPRIFLTEDEFENGYPNSMLYGKLGVGLANAVLSSILPYDSAWTTDMKLLSQFHFTVNESRESVIETKKCLADYVSNENFLSEDLATLTSLSTLKQLSAISLAHKALVRVALQEPHIHQPTLETYEDSAIFFLTHAQDQCSYSTSQQQLYDNVVNFKLSKKSMLQMAWSHLSQFATSLDCESRSDQCSDIF